jgi:hypothetical protein
VLSLIVTVKDLISHWTNIAQKGTPASRSWSEMRLGLSAAALSLIRNLETDVVSEDEKF